jgi:lipopolysaccharide/colanic/teichoic acid biosynthesis glycosyltransferase
MREILLRLIPTPMLSLATTRAPAPLQLPIHAVETQGCGTRYVYFYGKRIIDVGLAACLLAILFPLMLLITVLIKLDSAGPALFVQERIGVRRRIKNGRIICVLRSFTFYKFRSMVRTADQTLHEAYIRDFRAGQTGNTGNGGRFKLVNDQRVTRLGRVLRKTSLDELPQLINVLKGDMSLVGPRPALLYEAALYDEAHYERFCVVPGITGLWQATARCQVSFEEMVRLDITYARRCSFWLDMKIFFLTIPAVLSCRGAG